MLQIDSIFFDVDGTLVDARNDIANSINYTLKSLGVPERPKAEIVSYIGTGVKDLIRRSLGAPYSGLEDKANDIFSKYYIKHSADTATLYPHVKEVLEHFRDKKKYVLTNRYSKFAEITLKALGVGEYFNDILGGDDEDCLKPSACIIDRVLSKLKIDKSKSIIVGDMAIDVMTGKNSGVKTCWVSYGLGKPEEVKGLGPDYIIDDLIELKNIIK